MKAICLAGAAAVVLLIAVTLMLRLGRTRRRAQSILVLYLGILFLLVFVWLVLPPDCGFLPTDLQVEPKWLDFLLCVFFFSSVFFGGILQLYNLADRGFSLRILIDVLEATGNATSVEAAANGYAAGRGIAWMYSKRISGLIGGGLAVRTEDQIALTAKGAQLAGLLISLRRFLKMGTVPKYVLWSYRISKRRGLVFPLCCRAYTWLAKRAEQRQLANPQLCHHAVCRALGGRRIDQRFRKRTVRHFNAEYRVVNKWMSVHPLRSGRLCDADLAHSSNPSLIARE